MRNEFCTVLDVRYLTKGLVLYRSLAKVCAEFRLHVGCMDEESESLLRRLDLPQLTVVTSGELEQYDPEFAQVQPTRGFAEYCKTAKTVLCSYLLEQKPDLELLTFLDADLMFFNDPAPMLDELGDGSILLMPMNRAPARREEKNQKFGLYNTGTITFRPGETTTEALRSWRERCLAWSPGESGLLDQPLIQDWPERFDGVRAVTHRGCGIAPWNVVQYRVELRDGVPYVDDVPAIFYHHIMLSVFHSVSAFHGTRFLVPPRHLTRTPLPLYWERHAPYGVAPGETEAFWEPYVQEFGRALLDVRGLDPTFKAGLVDAGPPGAAEAEVEPTIESGYQPIRAWGRRLQPSWRYPTGDERVRLRVTEAGDLEVQCSLSGEESVYLREGETPFEDPPAEGADWEARPSAFHELSAEATFVSGAAEVRLIAIEYDERRRLRDHRLLMMEGLNALQFTTSEQMSQLRLALRFSGSGTVVLSPLRLSEPLASPSGHETRRPRPSDSESTSGSRLRVAVYGGINMNLIDGSSVWVQSVCQMLTTLPWVEVVLPLRFPEERVVLTEPLRAHPRIDLVEPGSNGAAPLSPQQAIDHLERLDAERRFDLVLLRGAAVAEEAASRGAFAGRLWVYYLPPHDHSPSAQVDHLRLICPAAEKVLCQTEPIRALAEAAASEHAGKLALLPPMIPPFGVARPRPARSAGLRLIYAGKFAPEYYFAEMLEVFGRLRRTHPEAELHLVGDKIHNPPEDPGFKPAAETALAETENLVWHGGVGRDRVAELLAGADVALSFRHPMMDKELATKVLEYGAAGCAVLLNRTPLYEELLGSDYPLFATDPGEALNLLSRVADDPALRAEAAKRCQTAARRFIFERVAERLEPDLAESSRAAHAQSAGDGGSRSSESTSSGDGEGSQWSEEYVNSLAQEALAAVGLQGAELTPVQNMPGRVTLRVERPRLLLKISRTVDPLERSLKICTWLHDSGFTAAMAPPQDTLAGPLQVRDDVWAGFWRWQDHDPEGRLQPRETGELLKQLHELLSGCPVELPVMDPISVKPHLSRLGEEAELDAAAIEFLATRFEELERGWREFQTELGTGPIHGHLNTSNILVTPEGPFFIDFDRVAMGPREWDLARLAPPRVLGWTAEEWGPFCKGYGYDLLSRDEGHMLQELVHVRKLIWMLSSGQFPRRFARARRLLEEWLRQGGQCRDLDWVGAFRALPHPGHPEAVLERYVQQTSRAAATPPATGSGSPKSTRGEDGQGSEWSPARAESLAREALAAAGLQGAGPSLVRFMSGRATLRVERSGLLLKVTPKERDELDRSLKICAWLQDSGFDAAAAPAQDIPAGPLRVRDGVWAGFWQWQDHDPESRPAPRETGELLKQLHELLSRCPIELPTLEPITADPRLPSLGEAAELDAAAVDFLATRYGELVRGWREFQTELGTGPIHGDFNLSNVLMSSGRPFLIDFDRVATGPREWDLATISPPRVLGWRTDEWRQFSEGYGSDLLAREDGEMLQQLVHVRSLIWMLGSRGFERRYKRGRRLLDEWLSDREKSCVELDWEGAFQAFPLPA